MITPNGKGAASAGLHATAEPRLVTSGARCRIERSLGAGGEGEVFSVEVVGAAESAGRYALKWYHPYRATAAQRAALLELIRIGRPHARFLWPLDLAELPDHQSFGYLMPLRPPEYRGIIELVKGLAWSPRVLATLGYELADSFLRLHARGLCYRDINFGNVFYRPADGAVMVCDNDNVGINASPGHVWGTPFFMAPEVVRRERQPDSYTDLHSLAVLLFWMLVRHHPLIGARELEFESLPDALEELCGTTPRFIFDPHDDSNRPLPEYHGNALQLWPIYPAFVRARFAQAFGAGLEEREARVVESIWKKTMSRLRDTVFACSVCGAESFAELPQRPGEPVPTIRCWNDADGGHDARPRYVVFAGRDLHNRPRAIAASVGTRLDALDVGDSGSADTTARPVAEIAAHPRDPNVWGLRNETSSTWRASRANGEQLAIEPGRSVRLEDGLRVHFGSRELVVSA